jgi:hypothetical protein
MGKLSLGLGIGIGYVLGAQAGRARYEEIKKAAAGLMERPEVQQALERARATAPAPLQGAIGKLAGGGSGGQDSAPGPVDAGSDADGPPSADAPLPDPLIPPAKSG